MNPKFRIGDLVLVRGRIEIDDQRVSDAASRRVIKRVALPENLYYRAVVTGATVRCEGLKEWYGEGHSFACSKQVPVWLVRPAMRSAERPVFEEDLEWLMPVELHNHNNLELYPGPPFFDTPEGKVKRPKSNVPWILSQAQPYTESQRAELREEMKKWPRLPNGRWASKP